MRRVFPPRLCLALAQCCAIFWTARGLHAAASPVLSITPAAVGAALGAPRAPMNWSDSTPGVFSFYSRSNLLVISQREDDYELGATECGERFPSFRRLPNALQTNAVQFHSLIVTNGSASWVTTTLPRLAAGEAADSPVEQAAFEFTRTLPWPIKDAFQPRIASVKLTLDETGNAGPLAAQRHDFAQSNVVRLVSAKAADKPSAEIKEIRFVHSVPDSLRKDDLLYGFVTSYAALLRAYDASSGRTRDHADWPAGDFDSVPACGFQALGAAMAWDLGIVEKTSAQKIAAKSIQAFLSVAPYGGLLPHWIRNGKIHPNSEYSTVDSALALWSGLLGAMILDLPPEQAAIRNAITSMDWAPLTTEQNTVSHGYYKNQQRIPYYWTHWGGETILVQLLRWYQDPAAKPWTFAQKPPAYAGRGFITELGALFFSELGFATNRTDRFGVNWRTERERHWREQVGYYQAKFPGSLAARFGLYGLSPAEINQPDGSIAYFEGGVGAGSMLARDGGGWIAPHYPLMSASLDPKKASVFIGSLRKLGVWQPLIGPPESVFAANEGEAPARWSSVQVSLNSFFAAAGLYHALRARDNRQDVIYGAARQDPKLAEAIHVLFP